MKIKCKQPGCPGYVHFDGEITLPGNFLTKFNLTESDIFLEISSSGENQELSPGLVRISGLSNNNPVSHIVSFFVDKRNPLIRATIFYLSCDNNPSHTLPYTITIKG
jgi:hypothetical protein